MVDDVKRSRDPSSAAPAAAVETPLLGLRGHRVLDPARSAGRRAAIIQAAARVFSRKSYYAATMNDIAQELGVSKGVLYYQFRSKEEVFLEILSTAIGDALHRLRIIKAESTAPHTCLRDVIRDLVRYNLDDSTPNYAAMLVIDDIEALSPEGRNVIRELQRDYRDEFADILRDGVRLGIFDIPDITISAMNILTAANRVSRWFRKGHSSTAGDVADQLGDQLVRGIMADRT